MSPFRIVELHGNQRNAVFDLAAEDGSLFCTRRWIGLQPEAAVVLAVMNKDRLVGGAAMLRQRRGGITILRNGLFARDCGLFVQGLRSDPARRHGEVKDVLRALVDWLDQQPRPRLAYFALPPEWIDTQPFTWSRFNVVPVYTYQLRLDLLSTAQIEAGSFASSQRRRELRKLRESGPKAELAADPKRVARLVHESLGRKGADGYPGMVDRLVGEYLLPEAGGFAQLAVDDGRDAATAQILTHRDSAYYLLGGNDGSHSYAGVGVIFAAIEEAHRRGISTFDFEGSMIPSVERFFRSFGGELRPFYRITRFPLAADRVLRRRSPQPR